MSPPPPPSSSSSTGVSSINPADENAEKPEAFGKVPSFPDPFASPTASLLGSTFSPALSLWIRFGTMVHEHYIHYRNKRTYQKSSSPFFPFFPLFFGAVCPEIGV